MAVNISVAVHSVVVVAAAAVVIAAVAATVVVVVAFHDNGMKVVCVAEALRMMLSLLLRLLSMLM